MNTYPKLTDVKTLPNYCLLLTFNEAETRYYDFKPNLNHKYYNTLKNKNLFDAVSVADGEIEWASGQDFCPNTLYENSVPAENN